MKTTQTLQFVMHVKPKQTMEEPLQKRGEGLEVNFKLIKHIFDNLEKE